MILEMNAKKSKSMFKIINHLNGKETQYIEFEMNKKDKYWIIRKTVKCHFPSTIRMNYIFLYEPRSNELLIVI